MNQYCILCGRKLPQKPLFVLENAPASAQDIPDAHTVKEDRGITLALCRCAGCGLVQFDCEPVPYYRDVIRAGGFTTTMTELRRRQYRHMIDAYHLEGKRFLEVGCGRGEFLKVLAEFPVQAYGMEHKEELVRIAREDGLNVWQEFPETADQNFRNGKFDVFLSFNFLEHQPEPSVMLQAIYHNLADDGMGLVTVPALEYIAEKGSYYELIRDHIAYYSFGTLEELLVQNGFAILEEELISLDTIAMIVKKMPKVREVSGMRKETQHASDRKEDLQGESMADSLVQGFEKVRRETGRLAADLLRTGRTLALWGAGHQGFTLAATTEAGQCARYMIDSAPFKQGGFAPASHVPIVPPEYFFEEPVDAVLITAPGYTDEIAERIRRDFGGKTEILAIRTDCVERL